MRTVKREQCKSLPGVYRLIDAESGQEVLCPNALGVCTSVCAAFQYKPPEHLPSEGIATYYCQAMGGGKIGEEVPEAEKPEPACVALVNEDGSLIGERAPVTADEQSGEPWQWIRDLSESVKRLLYKELEKRRRVIADDQENDVYEDEDGREQTNHNVINRAKIRIDSRKWMLGKMNPKKYSDKIQVDTTEFSEQPLFPDVPKNNSNK